MTIHHKVMKKLLQVTAFAHQLGPVGDAEREPSEEGVGHRQLAEVAGQVDPDDVRERLHDKFDRIPDSGKK